MKRLGTLCRELSAPEPNGLRSGSILGKLGLLGPVIRRSYSATFTKGTGSQEAGELASLIGDIMFDSLMIGGATENR